jgi:hypothetical protein
MVAVSLVPCISFEPQLTKMIELALVELGLSEPQLREFVSSSNPLPGVENDSRRCTTRLRQVLKQADATLGTQASRFRGILETSFEHMLLGASPT